MIVSILQRLGSQPAGHPGQPLQSRADSSPPIAQPGREGKRVRVSTGLKTAGMAADKPDNQVKDKVGPLKSSRARSQRYAQAGAVAPRGDTL